MATFLKTGTPGEIDQLSRMFQMENAITGSIPQDTATQSFEDYFAQAQHDCPQIQDLPLDEYVNDPNFWFINKDFEGLRMIHKDPCIFLVPDLLSLTQCAALMMKAGPHVVQSKTQKPGTNVLALSKSRTSWEVFIPREEVPATQKVFSGLLRMPVENMEPVKVLRYKQGEFFKRHNDAANNPTEEGSTACPIPFANRAITLFVYLNTLESGGETAFQNYGIKVKPRAGMGVIHFPSYLNTATYTKVTRGAVTVGSKVQGKTKNGVSKNHNGTVIEVNLSKEKNNALVRFDNKVHGTNLFSIDRCGDLGEPGNDFTLLPHMKGKSDQRVSHEAMPVIEEKFIMTQICWPGPFDHTKSKFVTGVNPLNDGIIL
jgi:hypothetical protein